MSPPRMCAKCGRDLLDSTSGTLCTSCIAQLGHASWLEPGGGDKPSKAGPVGSREESLPSPESDIALERAGAMVGRYKLLEQIGEGGFGVVFLAEQLEPVQRKVALKIIKPGMDSRAVVARFEAERQALALMDHPNIARVFDGGVTQVGRPYFVMELVRGIPVTAFCDQRQLTTIERLQLFLEVCKAVQHAHQKGIIHRDLKSSNILVTLHDGEPVPKIIDFGVAKALGQKLTDKTLFTGFLRMIGTPAYMSPEQAELSGLDIDTRSDLYSLGVLLYELLTGVTPFDAETFRNAALDEVRRMIRETEPAKPSTRLETLGDRLAEVAKRHHTDAPKLIHCVKGDLDWIVMKCLEKDRRRRYETANGLARDLERHLSNEPVEARPPSAVYRLRKFARRNRQPLAIAALSLAILLSVAGGVGWGARVRAAQQARLATEVTHTLQEAEQWEAEGDWAASLSAAKRARSLLPAGGGPLPLDRRVNELLSVLEFQTQLERIRTEAKGPVPGEVFDAAGADRAYGEAFLRSGMHPTNLPALVQNRSTTVKVALAAALDDWADTRRTLEDKTWKELVAVAQTLDPDPWRMQLRQAWADGDRAALDHLADSATVRDLPPATLVLLAQALKRDGRDADAVSLLRQGQRMYPDDFWINCDLAVRLMRSQPARPDEAIGFFRAALALRPENSRVHANLGWALEAHGKLDEAETEYREAIRLDPDNGCAYRSLGLLLKQNGELEAALDALMESVRRPPEHADHSVSLGWLLLELRESERAIAAFREAVRLEPSSPVARHGLGTALEHGGDLEGAIAEYQEAVRLDPMHSAAHSHLGNALSEKGLTNEALAALEEAICLDPDSGEAHFNFGRVLKRQGQVSAAEAAYLEAIRLNPQYAEAHVNLGNLWQDQGRLAEAEVKFREAIRLKPWLFEAHDNLGNLLKAQGKLDEAIAEYREAIRLHPENAQAYSHLGNALSQKGLTHEALAAHRQAVELGPGDGCAYHNLGWALEQSGDLASALEAYRESVRHPPLHVDHFFNLGLLLISRQRWEEAVGVWQEGVRLGPDNPWLHVNLGVALFNAGKTVEAEQSYLAALAVHQKTKQPADVNFGEMLKRLTSARDSREASEIAREFHSRDLPQAEIRRRLAFCLSAQGKLREALVQWRKAAELDAEDAELQTNLAWHLATAADADLHDGPRAVIHGKKAVDLDPSANNWNNLGVAYYRAGNWQEAVQCLEKASGMIQGGDRFHRFFLAMAHWQLGNQEQARDHCGLALAWMEQDGWTTRQEPKADEQRRFRAEAETLLGLTLADREALLAQAYAQQIEQASVEVARTPTNAAPWLRRARLYARQGRYEAAATDWARGIALSADTTAWNSARKVVCHELAGWPEVFGRVAERVPEETALWIGRGQYHALRSRWADAAKDYARAFRARASTDEVIFEYAGVLLLTGDEEGYHRVCTNLAAVSVEPLDSFLSYIKARTCGIRATECVPPQRLVSWAEQRLKDDDRAWVWHVLGLARYRAGEFERAVEALEKSNARQWNELAQVQNWLVLAMAQHPAGKGDEPRQWLAKALERLTAARPKNPDEPVNVPVPDWIALELLRREAELLLKDASTEISSAGSADPHGRRAAPRD